MRSPFYYGVGGVLSGDIAVPDHARELAFYAKVLTTGSDPLWRDDLTNNQGTPIIGLGERVPEYEALPLQWMPHIQVADVGASAARARELGGKVVMIDESEGGACHWAVFEDPMGAGFGLVGVEEDGPDLSGHVGKIAWLTLVAPDVAAASRFYEQVIGWSPGPASAEGGVEMRLPDGASAAEVCPASGGRAAVPPVWILSLPVDDLEESLRRVRESGGEIVTGSADAGHAVVRDPVGVVIGLQSGG